MTHNTTKPLWKVLNEQRTQVEWVNDGHTVATGWQPNDETIADFNPRNFPYPTIGDTNEKKCLYNAQYTALAVNNLASLAEALEAAMEEQYLTLPTYKKIKEALARIS